MKILPHFWARLGLVALAAGLFGCGPRNQGSLDEEKDPHYLEGLNRMKSFDHKGAIDSFERALETNPQLASAHYRLGLLYEEKEADPAAAIYHYTRLLRLRPNSEEAKNIEPRIAGCKMDLAKSISFTPQVNSMQRDVERLNAENMELRKKIESLQAQLSHASEAVRAAPSRVPPPLSNNLVRPPPTNRVTVMGAPSSGTREPPKVLRKYVIKEKDTAAAISRRHGIPLDAFMKANPGLDPRRLKPGQTVLIPGS